MNTCVISIICVFLKFFQQCFPVIIEQVIHPLRGLCHCLPQLHFRVKGEKCGLQKTGKCFHSKLIVSHTGVPAMLSALSAGGPPPGDPLGSGFDLTLWVSPEPEVAPGTCTQVLELPESKWSDQTQKPLWWNKLGRGGHTFHTFQF